jgi:hypothetical protein
MDARRLALAFDDDDPGSRRFVPRAEATAARGAPRALGWRRLLAAFRRPF